MPYPRAVEETKELPLPAVVETAVEHSLMEDLTNKPKLLTNALKQVDDIKRYLDAHNGIYPSRRSNDPEEHAIAVAIECIRKEIRGKKTTAVTQARLKYLAETIPDFQTDGVDLKFQTSINRLKDFYAAFNRLPAYGGPEPDEKLIYGTMQRCRQAFKEKDLKYLTPDRVQYLSVHAPFILIEPSPIDAFAESLARVKEFVDTHTRLPLRAKPEEAKIHQLYYSLKDQVSSFSKNTELQRLKQELARRELPSLFQ